MDSVLGSEDVEWCRSLLKPQGLGDFLGIQSNARCAWCWTGSPPSSIIAHVVTLKIIEFECLRLTVVDTCDHLSFLTH